MGVVQHRQIKNHLERNFARYIDVSDYDAKPQEEREVVALTRSLAAFAIANTAGIEPEVAAKSVVDGFDDNGIDGIYYSEEERILYLCQSKWSMDGAGAVDQGSMEKFTRGIKDLLALRFDRFNKKINLRKSEIEIAINNTSKINILVAYSGSDKIAKHPSRVLQDQLAELNDTGEVAFLTTFDQEQLYIVVSQGGMGDPVNVAVQLFDWGQTKSPYQAFYGQVAASDIAQWGAKFRQRIFSKNIRAFLGGKTAVNEAIAESIRTSPSHFWYLNNGITALCGSISKRPIGGSSHDAGTFDCENVAIVNGAQTVGTITELGSVAPEQLAMARVPIRLISLQGCPLEFASEVTRATNTQNRVDSRNFVALDQEQARIRAELLVDGVDYEYRQAEGEPHGDNKFGLVDATVALACSAPTPDLAVQAKREISKLWEDLSRAPYKLMFNGSLTGMRLWQLVQVLREIDGCLDSERILNDDPKNRSIIVNGNRLIAHMIFAGLKEENFGGSEFDISRIKLLVEDLVSQACGAVRGVVDANYEDAYLAHLFKNLTKCRDVVARVGNLKPDESAIAERYAPASEDLDAEIPF